jgi:hypothetical protein
LTEHDLRQGATPVEGNRTDSDSETAGLALILPMIFGGVQGQLLAVAANLDLAERLTDTAQTPAQLARATGTDPRALARVLRALAKLGVLEGDDEAGFRCTPAGRLLRRDSDYSMHHYAIMNNRDWLVSVGPRLLDSVRSGVEAFDTVHGASCYEYLTQHPDDASVFNAALTELSRQDELALTGVYDFSGVRRLADVGGGEGLLIRKLLESYHSLTAVLLDLPEVVAGATAQLDSYVASGRCEIVAADFRDGVPPGADLYMLKRVVSTCPADHIEAVLKHIRNVIPADGRLLIADPDPDSRYGVLLDILMLVATGGGLRSLGDMTRLLGDTGFRLERSFSTPTTLRVIEAAPA